MRSLLISGLYFPPELGGISQVFGSLTEALGSDRVCSLTPVPGSARYPDNGHHIYRRPKAFHAGRLSQILLLPGILGEIILRERPKAVQLATAYDAPLGLLLQRTMGWPFVVWAHGNEVLDAIGSPWGKPREALHAAYRVIAVSNFTRDLVCQAGVPRERVEVIHPGCDHVRFTPRDGVAARQRLLPDAMSAKIILTVGGLVARKGHDMVIRSLPAVLTKVPETLYVIVGDGPNRPALEALVAELHLEKNVRFVGKAPIEDLPEYYAASDLFVMASRAQLDKCDVEGFGLVYLEAASMGKPAVAGRSGGIGDAVVDGETGLLVDPENPAAIGEALARILGDATFARTLGETGRARVLREFTWERVADRVHQLLEAAVAAPRRTA